MKRFFCLFFCLLSLALYADNADNLRQALQGALDNARGELANSPLRNRQVAVLPIAGQGGESVTQYLKTILTQAGCVCLEGKDEAAFQQILKEMAWNARNDDILTPDEVAALGKLKGIQCLVYGTVLEVSETPERVFAEISLHATDVETRQHVWGGLFANRFYVGKDLNGVVSLDEDLRAMLKEGFDEAIATMLSPEYSSKLSRFKSVTVVPLAGDIDQYMTGLFIGGLTRTSLAPVNPRIPSLSLLRSFVRDGKLNTDAIAYGAVRELYVRKDKEEVNLKNLRKTEQCTAIAEIQLFVEEAQTGHILWSQTISKSRPLVKESVVRKDDPALADSLVTQAPSFVKWIGWIVLGLIALVLILKFISAIVNSNRLR